MYLLDNAQYSIYLTRCHIASMSDKPVEDVTPGEIAAFYVDHFKPKENGKAAIWKNTIVFDDSAKGGGEAFKDLAPTISSNEIFNLLESENDPELVLSIREKAFDYGKIFFGHTYLDALKNNQISHKYDQPLDLKANDYSLQLEVPHLFEIAAMQKIDKKTPFGQNVSNITQMLKQLKNEVNAKNSALIFESSKQEISSHITEIAGLCPKLMQTPAA